MSSILVIIVCLLYINVNAETEILYGDTNGDGGVDGRDATQIQRYVAGTTTTLLSVEGKEIVAPNEQSGSTEPEVDPKEGSDQVVNVENTALKVPLVILTISFSLIIAGIVTTSVALLRKEEQQKIDLQVFF